MLLLPPRGLPELVDVADGDDAARLLTTSAVRVDAATEGAAVLTSAARRRAENAAATALLRRPVSGFALVCPVPGAALAPAIFDVLEAAGAFSCPDIAAVR